ncbi:hypothetical protein [Amycolatopsis sp. FDAARGOS 1241]|uniref:hypothetical protein n=1 Tax=Amycolatopsis sp. FDAARGOS 1241 TaxID=2778070 RepID=UPI001950E55A|nr:hypothetical protein [Amycolatopsis sp. FDAARGOS 1241]QRP49364.1 hypothetical protein I6J71_17330 [Amycolatopsis sp. FDAARGOS 1241]
MASYLGAGPIVAGAAGLALWRHSLSLSSFTVGLLGAISANALSAAVGSAIGGRLGTATAARRSTRTTCCSTRSARCSPCSR